MIWCEWDCFGPQLLGLLKKICLVQNNACQWHKLKDFYCPFLTRTGWMNIWTDCHTIPFWIHKVIVVSPSFERCLRIQLFFRVPLAMQWDNFHDSPRSTYSGSALDNWFPWLCTKFKITDGLFPNPAQLLIIDTPIHSVPIVLMAQNSFSSGGFFSMSETKIPIAQGDSMMKVNKGK